MKLKKRIAKGFYDKRELPTPQAEYWPEDSGELRELLTETTPERPRVLIGDGQHLRSTAIGERSFDVIRTEHCDRILSVDRESKIIRAEAGMRWSALQEEATDRGLSLERYALYPSTATIGGLIARHQPTGRELWDGDLRTFCCALSATSPGTSDYRYLPAPRKAAGPDIRYLFIGGEGLYGGILDVSLVAWDAHDGRLLTWAVDLKSADDIVRKTIDAGARASWINFAAGASGSGTLRMAFHGPSRYLDQTARTIEKVTESKPDIGDAASVRTARTRLETSHPERRSLAASRRTAVGHFSTDALAAVAESVPKSVEAVQVWSWTRHSAIVFFRFKAGKTIAELPTEIAARALDLRPVLDEEPVRWSHWTQTLKLELDPGRALAVGP